MLTRWGGRGRDGRFVRDRGETVTGTLASKWELQQGPPRHPNRDRLFLTLLDATAPEETLVGSVLFDIRRFPLLRSVPRFFMLQGCVLGDLWGACGKSWASRMRQGALELAGEFLRLLARMRAV